MNDFLKEQEVSGTQTQMTIGARSSYNNDQVIREMLDGAMDANATEFFCDVLNVNSTKFLFTFNNGIPPTLDELIQIQKDMTYHKPLKENGIGKFGCGLKMVPYVLGKDMDEIIFILYSFKQYENGLHVNCVTKIIGNLDEKPKYIVYNTIIFDSINEMLDYLNNSDDDYFIQNNYHYLLPLKHSTFNIKEEGFACACQIPNNSDMTDFFNNAQIKELKTDYIKAKIEDDTLKYGDFVCHIGNYPPFKFYDPTYLLDVRQDKEFRNSLKLNTPCFKLMPDGRVVCAIKYMEKDISHPLTLFSVIAPSYMMKSFEHFTKGPSISSGGFSCVRGDRIISKPKYFFPTNAKDEDVKNKQEKEENIDNGQEIKGGFGYFKVVLECDSEEIAEIIGLHTNKSLQPCITGNKKLENTRRWYTLLKKHLYLYKKDKNYYEIYALFGNQVEVKDDITKNITLKAQGMSLMLDHINNIPNKPYDKVDLCASQDWIDAINIESEKISQNLTVKPLHKSSKKTTGPIAKALENIPTTVPTVKVTENIDVSAICNSTPNFQMLDKQKQHTTVIKLNVDGLNEDLTNVMININKDCTNENVPLSNKQNGIIINHLSAFQNNMQSKTIEEVAYVN